MNGRGTLVGVTVLAALAVVALAVVLWTPPADATITGTPLPPWGDDWVIDRDTNALNEKINLYGRIVVQSGTRLYMKSVTITIVSDYPGEHGITVEEGGEFELEVTTIEADEDENGWSFEVWGALNLHDDVTLYDVDNGLQLYSDYDTISIDKLKMYSQGQWGIFIDTCNPSISNSEVYHTVPAGWTGYGVFIQGDPYYMLSAPVFDGLYVKVSCTDEWERFSNWEWGSFYIYGMYADGAYFDPLEGITISFDERLDATLNTTGTGYLFVDFNTYGIYLTGSTELYSMQNVEVIDGSYFVDAKGEGGLNSGYIYLNNNFYGLYNDIWWGSSPATLSGLTIRNHKSDYNGNNIFNEVYKNSYGSGISWWPGATVSYDLKFTAIELSDLEVGYLFQISESFALTADTCILHGNYIQWNMFEFSYRSNAVTFTNNKITENILENGGLFYAYYFQGKLTIEANNISYNEYYQLIYMYYNRDTVKITLNTFAYNKESQWGSDAFFHFESQNAAVTIESNLFLNNTYRYFLYSYYARGDIEVLTNNFTGNNGNDRMFYVPYANNGMSFKSNEMYNNTMAGGIFCYYNYRDITITDNVLKGNQIGAQAFLDTWGYNQAGFIITDNKILENSLSGSMFKFFGLGYWKSGGVTVTIENNIFFGNSGSSATNNGLIFFQFVKQTFSVSNNYFENNSASCIVNYAPYTYGYSYQGYSYGENHPTYWFYYENNEFYNNSGKCIAITECDNNNIQIRQNKAHGNEDYVVFIDQTTSYMYIYNSDPYIYIYGLGMDGPDTIRIESNNISGNPGGGIYARTNYYDPDYYYYEPGNPAQEVSVKNNFLMDNGKAGWSLLLSNLFKRPSMKSNNLDGSAMGQYLGMIMTEAAGRQPFPVEYRDLVQDGGDNGVTAFGFEYIEAAFYDCSLLNYTECLYAKDCEVNTWDSAIPEGSGKTEGKGRIFVHNSIEIWVTWANATGVDSFVPVPRAMVSLLAYNGEYSGGMLTDEFGKLPVMENILTWKSLEGTMYQYSPYNATVSANQTSTLHNMHIVGNHLGPADPMRLMLVDIFIPEVIISNPQEGTLVATSNVVGEGFLFERGSGIVVFQGQTEMDPTRWDPVDPNVLWVHTFMGLSEGEHNLTVRAKDLSGNWNQSTVKIVTDLTDPTLGARLEYTDGRPVPYDPVKGGYFVREKEIAINGSYSDNFAPLRDIIIRINGVPEWIPASMSGKIFKRVRPDQGINTFIIDATDTAGRRTTVRLYVSLDSYAPTVYLYTPLQGTTVGNRTLAVTGLTEPNTRLTVLVTAAAGERTYEAVSANDGIFAIDVELFENIQKLILTATDSANNPTQLSRDVTLDTTPPDFIINRPDTSPLTTNQVKYTVMGQMTNTPEAIVYINGQKVLNTGVFARTLVLEEGSNLIEIRAEDSVGNAMVKYVTLIRDTVKPILEVIEPAGDYLLTNQSTIRFYGTSQVADKVGGGVLILHKGTPYKANLLSGEWKGKATWEYFLELGPNDLDQIVEVKAVDLANNEVVVPIHIVLDNIAPVLRIDEPAQPLTVKTPRVNISGLTDETVLVVYIQGIEFPVRGGEFSVVWPLTAGRNPISIVVKDDAGNENKIDLAVTYEAPTIDIPPEPDEMQIPYWWGIVLIVAAVTIIVTALFVSSQRAGRGGR